MIARSLVTLVLFGGTLALGGPAAAHITPPVVLVSDRDALVSLLSGAQRFFVREIRPSPEQRQAVQKETGTAADEDFYRFYLGRDGSGRLVAAAVFVTDFTIHGPVRVAVALGPDGTVKGVTVVEVTEETYVWIKPLIDQHVVHAAVGQEGRRAIPLAERAAQARLDAMPQFYAQVVAGLVRRAAVLFDVGVKPHV